MKYIIDIPDEIEWGVVTCRTEDGFYTRDFDSLEELNFNYINEHFGHLQDAAYQKGYRAGRKVEYQRGLNDAWEAARKIIEMTDPPYWEIFNEYKDDLFGKISASEAIEKLKAYEEKQKVDDEIKVGDEIKAGDYKWIVTANDGGIVEGIDAYGNIYSQYKSCVKKTGRYFNIDKILKEMKEEDFSDF